MNRIPVREQGRSTARVWLGVGCRKTPTKCPSAAAGPDTTMGIPAKPLVKDEETGL